MEAETQENLIRRYLLGDLQESETDALEVKILADDETFERVWQIEEELVEAHVHDRLSAAARKKFETHYQASPVHRRRISLTRSLIQEAKGLAGEPAGDTAIKWYGRFSERFRVPLLSWQSAVTAAFVIFAIAAAWLVYDRSRLHEQQAQLRVESQQQQDRERQLAQQLATAEEEKRRLESELQRLQSAPDVEEREPVPAAESRPTIVSLLLSPTLIRGAGTSPTAVVTPQTGFVRLRMSVDREHGGVFQIDVNTVDGRRVWTQPIVQRKAVASKSSIVTAQVPARKLPVADYILTLSAADAAGHRQEINRYFFRVIKR